MVHSLPFSSSENGFMETAVCSSRSSCRSYHLTMRNLINKKSPSMIEPMTEYI